MKVIQLVMSRQFRGAEIFALQLSSNLMALDVTVKWVALYPPPEKQLTPTDVDWSDLSGNKKPFMDGALLLRFKRLVKDFQPDIIQANAGDTLKYAVLLKVLFGFRYKIIFRNASMVSLYMTSWAQRSVYSILYQYVDRVISVSEHSKEDFIKTFPAVSRKIEVIPNGLNVDSEVNRLKEFNPNDFNIVHVAGFSFEKNHSALLRIFNSIKKKLPSAKLWLVGDGPLRSMVEREVMQLNLTDVTFTGTVSNPLDYISSAHVLVLPSIIEGLPGVILEAMFCRTPVVAFDVGGIAEVVKDGETGWLVKPNDEDGFVHGVMAVRQSNPDHLERIKSRAYQLVMKEYDNRAIAGRFLAAYRKFQIETDVLQP